jgi:cell division protein FtsB
MFPETMSAAVETPRPRAKRPDVPEPLRRKRTALPSQPSSSTWRRALNYLLMFAAAVLIVDALVGERGLVATTRARRVSDELTDRVERMRRENGALRETARRLREDAGTIESEARDTLGLIRPGEVLVVVKDVKPSK